MLMLLGGRVGTSVPRTRTGLGILAENQPVHARTEDIRGTVRRTAVGDHDLVYAWCLREAFEQDAYVGSLIEGGDHHGEPHLEASIGYSVLPLASAVRAPLCPIIYAT
jgi:hypothetical protein